MRSTREEEKHCLARAICLIAFLAQPCIAQEPLGALYRENLPGGVDLPAGTFDIQAKIREVRPNAVMLGVLRLPTGHYLVSFGDSILFPFMVELDKDLEIVASLEGNLFQLANFLTHEPWAGPESRVWSGSGNILGSFDWRNFTFDPPFAINSPYGQRFLQNCADCRPSSSNAIVEVNGQLVVVSAGSAAGLPFHYHLLGGVGPNFPIFKPTVSDTFTPVDHLKGNAAYDPVRGTIWWSILDTDQVAPDPFRFVEYDLDGQITGRIFQPDIPLGPLKFNGSADIEDADMYFDANGNRVLVFIYNHLGREILAEVNADFVYGDGCNGELDFTGEPLIGGSFDLELANATVGAGGFAILWRGAIGLDAIPSIPGLSNCGLHLVPNRVLRSVGTDTLTFGSASWTQSVPLNSSLVGLPLGFQWLLPTDPNVIPIDLSPAGGLKIGASR